jgi:hypothetical protein
MHTFARRAFYMDTLFNAAQIACFNIDMVRKKLRGKIGRRGATDAPAALHRLIRGTRPFFAVILICSLLI